MLGFYIDCDRIAVACRCVNDRFVKPLLAHKLLTFNAVLLGILLKVEIVQQTDNAPEICLVRIAKLLCEVFHNTGNYKSVLYMERIGVIFFEQLKRLFFVQNHGKSLQCYL